MLHQLPPYFECVRKLYAYRVSHGLMPKKEFVEWAYDAYRRRMQELGQNLRRGSGTPVSDIKCVITESNATIDKLLADVPSEIACAVKERVFVEI